MQERTWCHLTSLLGCDWCTSGRKARASSTRIRCLKTRPGSVRRCADAATCILFTLLTAKKDIKLYDAMVYQFRYARGAYGWPMLHLIHPCTGPCRLLGLRNYMCPTRMLISRSGQCGKDCFVAPEGVVADNCCQCSFSALKSLVCQAT